MARSDSPEGIHTEGKYSIEELKEYSALFRKLFVVQDIILKVNKQYIYSASQDDDYRTEPKFLLQGSYRNMNKITEKIEPIMNDNELKTVIMSHYTDESQLLTSDSEFNLLKFKELAGWSDHKESERLSFIRDTFIKNKKLGKSGQIDQLGLIAGQFDLFNEQFKAYTESKK